MSELWDRYNACKEASRRRLLEDLLKEFEDRCVVVKVDSYTPESSFGTGYRVLFIRDGVEMVGVAEVLSPFSRHCFRLFKEGYC